MSMMTEIRPDMKNAAAPDRGVYGVVSICFLVALFEGLDIQSMGVAAPRLAPAFHLDPGQMGLVMSASTVGLMIGAALGGWISDQIGRKAVIVASMAALGLFSLGTAFAPDYYALLMVRILAGVGLGGAFPNLIALVSEVTPRQYRVRALGAMYCGMPLGGACAGALMASASSMDWRPVFYAGGIGPLVLIPLLMAYLPKWRAVRATLPQNHASGDTETSSEKLFGSRTGTTLLLWTSYFFTLLAVYLLLNWLPSLLVAKGYSRAQGATCSIILNAGAVVGSIVLGALSDSRKPKWILIFTYAGMIASLLALTVAQGIALYVAAFIAGYFVIGGQLALYAIAPSLYPIAIRGTGVGAAVAVGRLGSIAGPLLAGALLVHGFGANAVPTAAMPGLLVAFCAVFTLAVARAKY
jgi:MFS transporter, AAHS family, 3-hydroxyphenylpropionic acid transporter